jgi:predicted phosphodiesterase
MNIKRLIVCPILFTIIVQTCCRSGSIFLEDDNSANGVRNSIIFISDTQAPMGFEKIFVRTHNNEEATKILFNTIINDSSVSSVFMLGDITAMSSFDNNWVTVDSFLTCLKTKNISAHATAGNHDYLLTSSSGEANLSKRFPDFKRTGYTVRIDSAAIILLNSNFKKLNNSEELRQQDWYVNELHSLERDSTIKLIVVGCHHSPYSNSSIVGYDEKVRDKFVPPFLKSSKCRLFISGHAHTFQYFKDTVANKHFLVIGGGGGLLHTLKAGNPDELQDQIQWNAEYRMFHFVRGVFTTDGLLLNVFMLKEDLTGPQSVFELLIPFSNQ